MRIPVQRPLPAGEILKTEFIQPLRKTHGLIQEDVADATGMSRPRINGIINDGREVTMDSSIRLGLFFGVPPDFFRMLQLRQDLWEALNDPEKTQEYKKIKPTRKTTGT